MKQILHIFLKDLRHFWIEIFVLLAAVAAFAWIDPKQWLMAAPAYLYSPAEWTQLDGLLKLVIVVAWWLLIARAVHDESLVGDRQFWLTRPYERLHLLAAKALFILAFVYLPIFLAQISILMRAGFNPASFIPGLLYNLLLITAIFVLPAAAIAAVTSNLVRMALVVLGVWLAFIAFLSVSAVLFERGQIHSSVSTHNFLWLPTMLCICAAVVVFQYTQRRAALARIVLLALPLVFWMYAAIFSSAPLVNHAYPALASGQAPPISIAVRQNVQQSLATHATLNRKQVEVSIPIQLSGIPADELWLTNGIEVAVQDAHGIVWTSPWEALQGFYYSFNPAGQDATIRFTMSRAVFDRVQPIPVTLHLTLAFTQARRSSVWATSVSPRGFAVPNFGSCSPQIVPTEPQPMIVGLNCRFALRQPQFTYVETAWTEGLCTNASPSIKSSGWIGELHRAPADLNLSSVEERGIPLSNRQMIPHPQEISPSQLCPGTPVTFTQYRQVRSLQAQYTFQNFRFPAYDARTGLGGMFTLGVTVTPQ